MIKPASPLCREGRALRSPGFRWVKAPTSAELTELAQTVALRIGSFLERQGLVERDTENSYLAGWTISAT